MTTSAIASDTSPPVTGRPLGPSWRVRVVTVLLLSLLPISQLVTNVLFGTPAERLKSFVWLVAITAISGAIGYAILRTRWWVDENGLTPKNAWFAKVAPIAWGDVVSIAVRPKPLGYVVWAREGRRCVVSSRFGNLDVFAYFALTRAPGSPSTDAVRRALELEARRFLPSPEFTLVPEPREASEMAVARLRDNPFYVLAVRPDAARAEVERAGQKLLALLGVNAASARTYATPLGPAERSEDKVRAALGELRVPERRLTYALEAHLDVADENTTSPADEADPTRAWNGALRAARWSGP